MHLVYCLVFIILLMRGQLLELKKNTYFISFLNLNIMIDYLYVITQVSQKNYVCHKHRKLAFLFKKLPGFSCLQMTRHSSVRCVSDSFLQTVIFPNTRKSMEIRSLHVKSAIRCSTGKMSCWTIKGDTWKVSFPPMNLVIMVGVIFSQFLALKLQVSAICEVYEK